MDRFVGKVAVVTGASAGIGDKTVKELLKLPIIVVGLARNLDKLRALSEDVKSKPEMYKGTFKAMKCDVTKEEEIFETFSQIKSNFGSIAILINNAGVVEPFSEKMSTMKTEVFEQIFATNLRGLGQCTREAIKLMTDDLTGGHIVNVNSVLGNPQVSCELLPVYTASKKGARAFSEALRREMVESKRNIKISIVSPGLVYTDMVFNSGLPPSYIENMGLEPQDVATSIVAILDTPPNVLISELTVVSQFGKY